MKGRIVHAVALVALMSVSGCDDAVEEAPRTDATSARLLSSTPGATDLGELPTGSLPPGTPRVGPPQEAIDLAALGFDSGSDSSAVRVLEMSDYGCGYCRKFHQETWPVLVEQFVNTGKVQWKFLPFVNGMFPNSPAATAAAECVLEQGAELFVPMNSVIWDRQSEWKRSNEPEPMLRGWAEEVGADMDRYDTCQSEGRWEYRVRAATAFSRQLGVRGTPSFLVTGYGPVQGALDAASFTQVLNYAHQAATASGG